MMSLDAAALVLRIVVGTIFLAQGWRKVIGPPDVPHGRGPLQAMIASRGFPYPAQLALMVGSSELICGALVFVGLVTRLATIPLAITLIMAIVRFKWSAGFIGGWDWPWSVLGATVAIAILGAGAVSIDALIGLA
jgi:putative oxidoreductase